MRNQLKIVALACSLSAGLSAAGSVPVEPLNTLVPVNWTCEAPEKHVKELRRMYEDYGLRKFVLIGPWRKRFSCTADVAAYAQTGRDIAYAKEALKDLPGVEIGWWLAPSIGSSRDFPGQRIMDCDGHVTHASCPLSPEFTEALCARRCVRSASARSSIRPRSISSAKRKSTGCCRSTPTSPARWVCRPMRRPRGISRS